jgi:hypothetical protein
MYTQCNPTAIQSPTYWKLIGRSMTGLDACAVAQQYSSATSLSLCFHTRAFRKLYFNFLLLYNCASLKLPKSGTVHWTF